MPLHPDAVQRLSFIRQLYLKAVEDSRQPHPMGAASLLTFHDAIELFLGLAAEHLSATVSTKAMLMDYFEPINAKLAPKQLEHHGSVDRLNAARRGLKHKGLIPAPDEVERLRNGAADFIQDNTPLVFGVDLASVSLVEHIANEKAKALLVDAQKHIEQGKAEDAIVAITRAYHALWRQAKPQSIWDHASHFQSSGGAAEERHINGRFNLIFQAVAALDSIVEKLALGVDPFRAQRFKSCIPGISESPFTGSYQVQWLGGRRIPSLDECRWCLEFVVDVGIRMQVAASRVS
jgi:hypothetical protein